MLITGEAVLVLTAVNVLSILVKLLTRALCRSMYALNVGKLFRLKELTR